MTPLLMVLAAYVVGATPTALWVGRAVYGVDLREEGSGNLGATNTVRVLGWKAGLAVMVADMAKGFVPVAFFGRLAGIQEPGWLVGFGAAAILGHVFSFWVGFKGGKGVATSTGVFLALAPWAVLVAALAWGGAVALTRYVSVGSIIAAFVLPAAVFAMPHRGGNAVGVFALVLALFILWAHRGNVERLRRGEERRLDAAPSRGRAS